MELTLREKTELLRQGIVRGYIIPMLEERDFIVSDWKRPVSLEDMSLRDGEWIPMYTRFTSWETYQRSFPLYVFFNTFYGDIHERAYRVCFVEFIINVINFPLKPSLIGTFTRLNVKEGYYWKSRLQINLNLPDSCVREIDSTYDELTVKLAKEGVFEDIEKVRKGGK